MIKFKDPFGQETILTILPIPFNKTVQLAVNSKYKYVAVWDISVAKEILTELEKAIQTLEGSHDKKI